jgi:hypothetical protein
MTDNIDQFHEFDGAHERDDAGDPASAARVDPDMVLITDYLANALSFEAEAAVERRMKEDEAFFEKAWPLLRAWQRTDDEHAAPRRVSRGVGTFTDEIRSMAAVRAVPVQRQESWIARLGRLFRRR